MKPSQETVAHTQVKQHWELMAKRPRAGRGSPSPEAPVTQASDGGAPLDAVLEENASLREPAAGAAMHFRRARSIVPGRRARTLRRGTLALAGP